MLTPIQLVESARSVINECDHSELCQSIDNKQLIVDVREPDEFAKGHIANAVNIPRGLIEFAIFDHTKTKSALNQSDIAETNITVYCKSGGRSALAAQSLKSMGFNKVFSLQGGIMGWEAAGLLVNKDNTYDY
jgi:rhodanese-related sulfurtransferase